MAGPKWHGPPSRTNGTYVRRNVPFRKEEDYCTNGLKSLESQAAPAPS